MKKQSRGITLIALVITIIILLILAGISINALTGNGLFEKAKLAKIYSRKAQAEENLNLEISRVQMDKTGNATIQDIYNDFSSIDNEIIDVIETNTASTNEIEDIVVIVNEYDEFSFTIGKDLSITEICGIAKNEWKGETLESEIKEGVSFAINSTKLTEGTILKINSANDTRFKKAEVLIGDVTVYSEEILNKKTYIKTLNINNLTNIEGLEFNKNYTTKLKMTLSNGEVIEENGTEVLNYTIGNANSLKELSNQVNQGVTFEGETILQIADISLSSISNWIPIGDFAQTARWFDGIYNGNEKEITNLNINNSEDRVVGLFGLLGYKGTVKNVILYGSLTQNASSRAVGGIVGRNEGTIENCINNANVIENKNNGAGGIVGNNLNSVKNCTNNGEISR